MPLAPKRLRGVGVGAAGVVTIDEAAQHELPERAIRAARPNPVKIRVSQSTGDFTLPTLLAIIGVILNVMVPSNLLELIGISYSDPTGSPLAKLHPGNYAAYLGFAILVSRRGNPVQLFRVLFRECRGPVVFMITTALCMVYSHFATGSGGLSLYLETWFPGGLLAILFFYSTPKARRVCGIIFIALVFINIAIGLAETTLHEHLLPLYFGADLKDAAAAAKQSVGLEFRVYALYDHPLTAAMITMMGTFMVLSMKLPRIVLFGSLIFCVVGLLEFGGRTALVTTVVILAAWGVWSLTSKTLRSTIRPIDVGAAIAAVTVVPVAFGFLMTQMDLGQRIRDKFYWDESANVRAVQWHVLEYFTPHDWMFGIDLDRLELVCYQIGLKFPFTDIENFWLGMFVSLGAVGYIIFLIGFFYLLAWLWQGASGPARILMIATIIVASSSNSLARKSNILTLMVPGVLCATSLDSRRRKAASEAVYRPAASSGGPRNGRAKLLPPLPGRPMPRPLRHPVLG